MYRLALVVSHPVPYQVPLYRALHKDTRIDEMVFSLDKAGIEECYEEKFRTKILWEVLLLAGCNHQFLKKLWNSAK